jgi:hypothetical protein
MIFGFFTYAKRLIDLFNDAVNVWLILGDEDALEIAQNALLKARPKQRQTMIHFAATAIVPMETVTQGVDKFPTTKSGKETVEIETVKQRHETLLDRFDEMGRVSGSDSPPAMKPENRRAIERADSKFFRTRYPDFPLWR